jgi:hypothetical protein
MLEDHPAGYPAAVAAQRVSGIELRGLTVGESGEPRPRRAPAGMMARQARDTSKIMDCGKPMIIGTRACALLRHARHIPIAGRS